MYFIGYFPGADFDSESQYGRQIHVYKFMKTVLERDEFCSVFFVDNDGGKFPNSNVHSVTTTGPFPTRLLNELQRSWQLIRTIRNTTEPTVLYTRESPHFAPLIAAELTDAKLVVESNGVPRNVRENVDSDVQYVTLTGVRWAKWRRADHVIAVSDSVADYLRIAHDVDEVTVVENGVDTDLFNCREDIADSAPYTLCYVGGLQPWQNIELMLETMAIMETDVTLLIVGGDKERQTSLRSIASNLEISDRVIFVGRVPHEAVTEYINRADLCFGPFAEDRPASPLKVYEYLACGREVVLVNNAGLEFLDNYPGIHRFEYADSATLAARIDSVLAKVETNRAGAEKVHEERSWRAVSESVLSLCQAISEIS